jgi:hypothetical protein
MRQQQAAAAAAAAQQEEEEVPYHVIDSNPGDVIAFDMRASHAAFNGFDGRRLCTVLFYVNPKTDAEIAGAKRRPFCVIFFIKNRSFCQDRLGTNIGKVMKRGVLYRGAVACGGELPWHARAQPSRGLTVSC